jgi:hypothetical protein
MRRIFALMLASLAWAAPGHAQTCAPARFSNHRWVESNAALYGADSEGLFKLDLHANGIQRVGTRGALALNSLRLSPAKRLLHYRTADGMEFLFDTTAAREHRLDIRSAGKADVQLSPGETRAAWLEHEGTEHRLAVFDLENGALRRLSLPNSPDPKSVFFDLTWSGDGTALTYAWRDADRQEFFRADLSTGVVKSIPPSREFGADEFAEGAYLLGKSVESGTSSNNPSTDSIALERGSLRRIGGKIVLSTPNRRDRVIVTPDASCGEIRLLAAFGGRYVLYSIGSVFWIYGTAENRRAILYSGEARLVY